MSEVLSDLLMQFRILEAYPVWVKLLVCASAVSGGVLMITSMVTRRGHSQRRPPNLPNLPKDPEQSARDVFRVRHGVRPLLTIEEGFSINDLAGGVLGYSSSPGFEDAPVFRRREPLAFEIHKLSDGSSFLLGFVSDETASCLETADTDLHVLMYPAPAGIAPKLVAIPRTSIVRYKDYPPRRGNNLEIQVAPVRSLQAAAAGGGR